MARSSRRKSIGTRWWRRYRDQHTGLHVCLLAARSRLAFNVRVLLAFLLSLPSPLRSPTAEFSWPDTARHIGVDAVAEKATAASRVLRDGAVTRTLRSSAPLSSPPLFFLSRSKPEKNVPDPPTSRPFRASERNTATRSLFVSLVFGYFRELFSRNFFSRARRDATRRDETRRDDLEREGRDNGLNQRSLKRSQSRGKRDPIDRKRFDFLERKRHVGGETG